MLFGLPNLRWEEQHRATADSLFLTDALLKTEVALSCHNYTIFREILETARKNKLSCSDCIPSSSSSSVPEVDIHFVTFHPLHALVLSLISAPT